MTSKIYSFAFIVMALILSGSMISLRKVEGDSDKIKVYGKVSDYITEKGIEKVKVSIFKNGILISNLVTDTSGRYPTSRFLLDNTYKIVFSKKNYLSKSIEFDVRNVPAEALYAKGWDVPCDLKLILKKKIQNCKSSFEKFQSTPYGKIVFNPTKQELDWEFENGKKLNAEIQECFEKSNVKK